MEKDGEALPYVPEELRRLCKVDLQLQAYTLIGNAH